MVSNDLHPLTILTSVISLISFGIVIKPIVTGTSFTVRLPSFNIASGMGFTQIVNLSQVMIPVFIVSFSILAFMLYRRFK